MNRTSGPPLSAKALTSESAYEIKQSCLKYNVPISIAEGRGHEGLAFILFMSCFCAF